MELGDDFDDAVDEFTFGLRIDKNIIDVNDADVVHHVAEYT